MTTDLTWQQLVDKCPTDSIKVESNKVVIDPSTLTGDNYTALSDFGVVEFCYKLLNFANAAQKKVNETLSTGNQLDSFPDPFFSSVIVDDTGSNPTINGTAQVSANVPLDVDNAKGLNG